MQYFWALLCFPGRCSPKGPGLWEGAPLSGSTAGLGDGRGGLPQDAGARRGVAEPRAPPVALRGPVGGEVDRAELGRRAADRRGVRFRHPGGAGCPHDVHRQCEVRPAFFPLKRRTPTCPPHVLKAHLLCGEDHFF